MLQVQDGPWFVSCVGFKAPGFTVTYEGKDIEDGIGLYELGGMDRKSVKE